jgi:hypothetical protein
MFPAPGEDVASQRCTKCEGDQKNAPVLGLTFIKGMQRMRFVYEGERILNPRDGAEYRARGSSRSDIGRGPQRTIATKALSSCLTPAWQQALRP